MAQYYTGPWYAEFFDGHGNPNADHGWFVVNEDTGRVENGPYASEQEAERAADALNTR